VSRALIEDYDAALFDLDGVIYLGPDPIPAAPPTVAALQERGVKVGFVTNNAARRTDVVAEVLRGMGIRTTANDVVSSAQAITDLASSQLPAGAKVLIVGTEALAEEARSKGLEPVATADDGPVAVIQGYHPQMPWSLLVEAGIAIQHGAAWYGANPDMTRPTDRGLVPGIGAQLAAVATTVDAEPVIAGKPNRPLLDATVARLGCRTPIFVGDRLDTDVLGANRVAMASMMVFSGAHGKHDLLDADPQSRPRFIAKDVSGLLAEPRRAVIDGDRAVCRAGEARVNGGVVEVSGAVGGDLDTQLDSLAAVLALVWAGRGEASHRALEVLDLVH
jgi:HAD superfamily hydrolase (TIGR01450 family)